jgi:hypothetical protein
MSQMRIVYLDQNYLAQLAKRRLGLSADGAVGRLNDQLIRLTKAGGVLCPFSEYHVYETAFYDNDAVRLKITKLVGLLSKGRCLRHPMDRTLDELSTLWEVRGLGRPAKAGNPIGAKLDCFPQVALDPAAREAYVALDETDVFRVIVESVRSERSFRAKLSEVREQLLAAEKAAIEAKGEGGVSLPVATRAQIEQYILAPEVFALIAQVAAKHCIDVAKFIPIVIADELKSVPSIASVAHLRARKDTNTGMVPARGDFLDAAHASSLGAADLVALDGRTAALAKNAAQLLGSQLVGSVADLLAALDVLETEER